MLPGTDTRKQIALWLFCSPTLFWGLGPRRQLLDPLSAAWLKVRLPLGARTAPPGTTSASTTARYGDVPASVLVVLYLACVFRRLRSPEHMFWGVKISRMSVVDGTDRTPRSLRQTWVTCAACRTNTCCFILVHSRQKIRCDVCVSSPPLLPAVRTHAAVCHKQSRPLYRHLSLSLCADMHAPRPHPPPLSTSICPRLPWAAAPPRICRGVCTVY